MASTTVSAPRTTKIDREAKRLARQQKQIEKELLSEMVSKVLPNGGKMVKYNDLKKISPLTDTQKHVFESWYSASDEDIGFILHGSAGTGKTFQALYFALEAILKPDSKYKKIIIVRSAVQTRDMGFLKGTEEEKNAAYELPYNEICSELTGNRSAYTKLKEIGKLEFMSTSFIRGISFHDSIIIYDEFQSSTKHELNSVITRVGKNTKIFFCGDLVQNDLLKNKNDITGFREFMAASNLMSEFRSFRFTPDDIVRSAFVKSWIIACERSGFF